MNLRINVSRSGSSGTKRYQMPEVVKTSFAKLYGFN